MLREQKAWLEQKGLLRLRGTPRGRPPSRIIFLNLARTENVARINLRNIFCPCVVLFRRFTPLWVTYLTGRFRMRAASVVVGPCPSYLPTKPLLRPPESRAPPNWPELALIWSPSVDAPSIVGASGEPSAKAPPEVPSAANDNLIDRTVAVWRPRSRRELRREDARQISENVAAFSHPRRLVASRYAHAGERHRQARHHRQERGVR